MSSASDFVIENGVLKKYVGSDGDVVIPEGVCRIDDEVFKRCIQLKNITIPRINPSNVTIPNLETLVKNNIYGIPQINAAKIGNANIKIGI